MNKEDQRPLSRRHAVGLVGMGMAAAAAGPALPQQPVLPTLPTRARPPCKIRGQITQAPFKEQTQPWPGLASKMDPRPDHGENSYRGSGRLAGRKALITGGDSGMGRAAAIAYAREGADVAINYFPSQEPDAREVIQLIKDAGRTGVSIPVTCAKSFLSETRGGSLEKLGGLDIVVCNAGRQQSKPSILDITTADFDATMKTNIYAPFWIIKAALPHPESGRLHHRHDFGAGLRSVSGPV